MADEKLIFDLLAGQNTVLKELAEIRAATIKTESSVGGIGSSFKDALKPVSAITTAVRSFGVTAVAAVASFVGSSIVKAAEEQEDAINRLNAALVANGNFSQETASQLQEYASQLQRTSKIGDEVTLSNLALLQSLAPLTKEGLIAANTAATNLSAALKIDLETAVRLVGKAANGNVEAFKRFGVEIQKGKNDTETFGNALTALNTKFGGAASNELNTFSGAIAQAGNAFSDIAEEAGGFITQNETVIAGVRAATQAFSEYAETLKRSREGNRQQTSLLQELHEQQQTNVDTFNILNATFVQNAGLTQDLAVANEELARQQRLVSDGLPDLFGSSKIEPFLDKLGQVSNSLSSIEDKSKDVGAALLKASGPDPEAIKKAEQAIKSLQDQVKNAGLSQFEIIAKEAKERTKIVKDNAKLAGLTGKETENLLQKIRLKNNEELSKAQLQANEKLRQETADNLKAFTDAVQLKPREPGQKGDASKVSDLDRLNVAGAVAIKSALSGAEGAVELVKTAIGFLSSGLSEIPVIGPIIGEIIDKLALAPAEFAKNIGEFFKALPNVISNILINSFTGLTTIIRQIPAFIMEALARLPEVLVEMFIASFVDLFISVVDIVANLPALIAERLPILIERFFQGILEAVQRLVAAMPSVARALANAMPSVAVQFAIELGKQAVPIAIEFINALVKEAPRFVTELIKALPSAFGGIGGGIAGAGGGLLGGALGGIGDVFGFAEGGIVPGGAPFTDRVPALLTPGEAVVDRTLVNRLEQFLTNPQQQSSGGGSMTVNLVIGEQQLANVILDLNRRGFRLT